ncbi:MAG: undecaprenyl diphosphate synthase family protein, partial [bacterium]
MNAVAEKMVVRNGLFVRDDLESRIAELDADRMPRHVAIICDGNGRWATGRGLPRPLGHRQGYQATRRIVRSASDLGIKALT